mgnify:CR=1 FL=1
MSENKPHKIQDERALHSVEDNQWGQLPEDNFGYDSDEERRDKRGLEDWELIEKIPESQRRVPPWFLAVIVVVLLVAIGLSFPFWGDRPGFERDWVNWGFGAALLYILVAGGFVYFMVHLYGSKAAGRLDHDPERDTDPSGAGAPSGRDDSDRRS